MVFGINSTRNADRKVNSTRLRLVLFCTFLSALLVLLIPNTTEKHAITYTNNNNNNNKVVPIILSMMHAGILCTSLVAGKHL